MKLCKPITRAFGHVGAAPIKVFIDQALHHPLMYFPAFYMLKGAVEGRALEDTVAKYRTELWDNLKACWMIWVPAQFVNFTLVPLHLRIPFVAGVSFAWTVVISVMRGTLDKSLAAAHPVEAAEPNSNSVFLAHTLELKREEQQQHAASEAAAHGASPAGASVVPVVVAAAQQQKAPVAATHRPVLNAAAAVTVQADAGGGAAIASAAVIRPVRLVSSSPDGLAGLKALAADQAGMGDDAPRTA